MKGKYKHLFFDMDGTVTRSRSLVAPEMKELFESIPDDIIIVSGAEKSQIAKQLAGVNRDVYILGQNGNQAVIGEKEIWWNKLSETARKEIFEHIDHIEQNRNWGVISPDDLTEDRVCQISYSCIGHNEDVSKKEKFDPNGELRQKLLDKHPVELKETDVKIGGTTCLDYFEKNRNKGFNVGRLIKHMGWNKADSVYFGDALYKGGNDETVVGIIDTISVEDEKDTYKKLKKMYENTSD
jgi:HAD superfamily hydrolase (TIGR01484 family)